MTNPQADIRGEPLDLETLLDFSEIEFADVEHAAEWWDEFASPAWVGALDSEPLEEMMIDES